MVTSFGSAAIIMLSTKVAWGSSPLFTMLVTVSVASLRWWPYRDEEAAETWSLTGPPPGPPPWAPHFTIGVKTSAAIPEALDVPAAVSFLSSFPGHHSGGGSDGAWGFPLPLPATDDGDDAAADDDDGDDDDDAAAADDDEDDDGIAIRSRSLSDMVHKFHFNWAWCVVKKALLSSKHEPPSQSCSSEKLLPVDGWCE